MKARLPFPSRLLPLVMLLVAGSVSPAQESATAPAKRTARTLALVIGISDYQEAPDLQFADDDARAFYWYLRSRAGGGLDSSQVYLLLNAQATSGNIVAALEWLKGEARAGDKTVMYFSGHGDVERLTDSHAGFLLTHDSPARVYPLGALPVYFVKDFVATLSNRGVRVTFITDACHSGKLAGGDEGVRLTALALSQQWQNEIKILSCQPGERSLEDSRWGGGRGLWPVACPPRTIRGSRTALRAVAGP